MRVAVLGSNSFAGRDFIDLLLSNERDEVLGISRSPERPSGAAAYGERPRSRFTFRQLDLNRDLYDIQATLDAFRPTAVVNFAAQSELAASWEHAEDFFRTNCTALAALIDHLSARGYLERFLQVSTSSVYADSGPPRTEDSPLAPGTPYGVSKAAFDLLLLAYYQNFGFPAQIVRPPNLYGPYQQLFRIVPKSIISLKLGRPVDVHGGGRAKKQYLHVRDASRAILAVLERGGAGQVYHVAPDDSVTVRDLIGTVCELLAKDFDAFTRQVEDRTGQQPDLRLESTKIRHELGWSPRISLRTGIDGVLDWIERDWNHIVEQPLIYAHRP